MRIFQRWVAQWFRLHRLGPKTPGGVAPPAAAVVHWAVFNPVEAADLFRDFCNAVLDNPKEGHNKLVSILESVRGN